MLQRLPNLNPSLRTKRQTLLQKIYRQWARIGEQSPKRLFFAEWKRTDIFTGTLGGDRVEVVNGGCAQDIEDYGELVMVCEVQQDRSAFCLFRHSSDKVKGATHSPDQGIGVSRSTSQLGRSLHSIYRSHGCIL